MNYLMPMLAEVSLSSGNLGQALIVLVIAVIVCAFIYWVIQNYIPEPLRKFGMLVLALLGVLVLINFVASLGGHAFITW